MTVERVATLVTLGRWREAQQLAESLLASEPDRVDLLGYRTQCLYEQGLLIDALTSANRMVSAGPHDDWGHRLRGAILGRMGRHGDALRAAGESVRLGPHNWRNHATYASAAIDVSGRLLEALDAARRSVALGPHEPDAHFVLGAVHHHRNEFAAARTAYERALTLDPEHSGAINNLTVLGGLRHTIKASRGFASALRVDPQNDLARDNLDALLINFTLTLSMVAAGGIVAALTARHGEGFWAPAVVAPCFTAALLAYVMWVASRVPRGVRRYAVRRWRHLRPAVWNSVVASVAIVVVYVVCFASNGEEIGVATLRPILLGLVILGVRGFLRYANR